MSATLTPFLFQTRTLARFARVGSPVPNYLVRSLQTAPPGRRRQYRDPIPFELPPELEDPDPSDDAEPLDPGTITPVEQKTFNQIFQELSVQGKHLPNVPPKQKRLPDLSEIEPTFLKGLYGEGQFNINAIMQDAAERQTDTKSGSGLSPLSPLESTYSAADREQALLRFPPSLRRAARTALGTLESARDITVTTEGGARESLGFQGWQAGVSDAVEAVGSARSLSKTLEVETLRREARLRVRSMMDEAEDDFALWDVVESEVFPLVEKLGISERQIPTQPAPKPQKLKRGRKKKAVAEEDSSAVPDAEVAPEQKESKRGRKKKGVAEEESSAVPDPDAEVAPEPKKSKRGRKRKGVAEEDLSAVPDAEVAPKPNLSMDIYGPIYPMLLLDALHLLDAKFNRPSPLVFSLLPRVKQLGLASYVLGVSTSFYNKLMSIMWERFGDAGGVMALLEEMRHAGLYFDDESKSTVHKMQRVLHSAARGDNGRFLRNMMDMPEYEPLLAYRLSHWVTQIDISIRERRKVNV